MASTKLIMPFLVLLFVRNCEAISEALPPDLPGPVPGPYSPVPVTPSYPGPGPSYPQVPASPSFPISPVPAAGQNSTIPVTPSYPVPGPGSYPPVPSSSPYPAPPYSRAIKAAYWPSFDGFPASSIDTSYFTHLYYAFLLPEPDTFKLNVTPFDQQKIPEFIEAVRSKTRPVKSLLSVGGGGNNMTVFSIMASSKANREVFIASTIHVARSYGFDGVDLDWEFPANDDDMSNLGSLYEEWHRALVVDAVISGSRRLLLTSAVYYASQVFSMQAQAYPTEAIRKYVDWVSPMCFDYHGSWENFTGLQAALYDPNSNISTYFGIGSWIQSGVPAKKLVMGLPMYGRSWKLQNPNVNGVGAPAIGVGPGYGTINYNQIVDFNKEKGVTVVYSSEYVSYYCYAGEIWIGYDDVGSIKTKVQFARSRGLGGYFFWALGQDYNWTISREALLTASKTWRHWH